MTSTTFFIIFIPILSVILLAVNLLLAPHNPYQEKDSPFECGFNSFREQNRTQFAVSFFIFGLLFLLFDLEILLVYPYSVSSYTNDIYGLGTMLLFFVLLTLGFIFELGKGALTIDSEQTSIAEDNLSDSDTHISLGLVSYKGSYLITLFNYFYYYFLPLHIRKIYFICYFSFCLGFGLINKAYNSDLIVFIPEDTWNMAMIFFWAYVDALNDLISPDSSTCESLDNTVLPYDLESKGPNSNQGGSDNNTPGGGSGDNNTPGEGSGDNNTSGEGSGDNNQSGGDPGDKGDGSSNSEGYDKNKCYHPNDKEFPPNEAISPTGQPFRCVICLDNSPLINTQCTDCGDSYHSSCKPPLPDAVKAMLDETDSDSDDSDNDSNPPSDVNTSIGETRWNK